MASFRKALHAGATGLEFDVRRCRDGQIVVIHDETIERTTNGSGRVSDLTYDNLKAFDAGHGEPIPLLSEVFDEFGSKCLLNIELKEADLTPDVKKLILQRRLEGLVIVSAFEWQYLASLTPEIPIALLTTKLADILSAAQKFGAAAIHPRKDIVTPTLVAATHHSKLRIHVWTVNEAAEISYFHELGVDGIFTDFPERCSTLAS